MYAATVGGLRASEPATDLAIALALASAARDVALPQTLCAIGEVSLSGDVRRVGGLERRMAEAARLGFTTALVPGAHAGDTVRSAAVNGITTLPVDTLPAALAAVANLRNRLSESRRPALHAVPDADSAS